MQSMVGQTRRTMREGGMQGQPSIGSMGENFQIDRNGFVEVSPNVYVSKGPYSGKELFNDFGPQFGIDELSKFQNLVGYQQTGQIPAGRQIVEGAVTGILKYGDVPVAKIIGNEFYHPTKGKVTSGLETKPRILEGDALLIVGNLGGKTGSQTTELEGETNYRSGAWAPVQIQIIAEGEQSTIETPIMAPARDPVVLWGIQNADQNSKTFQFARIGNELVTVDTLYKENLRNLQQNVTRL